MAHVKKIAKEDVWLPETVDVLFHLPISAKLRNKGFIVAHAIQYNVCVKAISQEEALEKLVNGIISRCKLAIERGDHPLNMASEDYMKAFFMGTPVEENEKMFDIHTQLSEKLKAQFNVVGTKGVTLEMRIRTVVGKQEEFGLMCISDLVAAAA